ncbi:MAG TPA: DUF1961 family protein, partial [Planctomycetota bacterium]|nr:DUF1961 family protein [Planctomycetota bacterium]
MTTGDVLLFEDFGRYPDGPPPETWWVEGGEEVRVEEGRLRVRSDPPPDATCGHVCTVWHRESFSGDLRVDFDAHVIASSVEANNINFFLFYADPAGTPLFETRRARRSAAYDLYHNLNGYIFTFLNDTENRSGKARFRMRRCPGFRLVDEAYDYHCRAGRTYHVSVTRTGGRLTCAVDGQTYLSWTDPDPLPGGLIGLRTFRTDLWWNRIRVTRID